MNGPLVAPGSPSLANQEASAELNQVTCPHCGAPATEEFFWSTRAGQSRPSQKRQIRCSTRPLQGRRRLGPPRDKGCPIWIEEVPEAGPVPANLKIPIASKRGTRSRKPGPPLTEPPLEQRIDPVIEFLSQLPDEILQEIVLLAALQKSSLNLKGRLRARLQRATDSGPGGQPQAEKSPSRL
jgi:hypothetical protein